jgi:hypothetical protein
MEEQIFEYDPQLTLGYVIGCYEPFSGEVYYRSKGTRLQTAENKDSFMIEETYTFKGAKKAIANLQRYGGNSICPHFLHFLPRIVPSSSAL